MNQRDKVAILCKRVSDMPDPGPEAGRGNCWTCGVEVWISPNSRRRMREFQATLYCNVCGMDLMKTAKHEVVGTPGQMAELSRMAEAAGGEFRTLGTTPNADEYLRKMLNRGNDAGSA